MDIKPVIVTALFDIDRPNWKNFHMSYDTYLAWGENVLSIDCPIVVYTEEKFFKRTLETRKKYDKDLNNTKIIVLEKTDLEMYQLFYNRMDELMKSDIWKKIVQFDDVPEMCQPWYNTIMHNKISFMYSTYLNKYFDNNIVIWKDYALYREKREMYANVKWPDPDKLNLTKPTFYQHHEAIRIFNHDHHILSQQRFTHGGSFIIPGHLLNPLRKKYINEVKLFLDKNLVGSDEKYFDFIIKESPEQFNLLMADWREYFLPFAFDN